MLKKVINGNTNDLMKVRKIISIHGIYEMGCMEPVFFLMKDVLPSLKEKYSGGYVNIV